MEHRYLDGQSHLKPQGAVNSCYFLAFPFIHAFIPRPSRGPDCTLITATIFSPLFVKSIPINLSGCKCTTALLCCDVRKA